MQLFLQWMITNALLAAALAPLAWLVAHFTRSPGLAHACWLIVLLRLVMPPLVAFPVWLSLPMTEPPTNIAATPEATNDRSAEVNSGVPATVSRHTEGVKATSEKHNEWRLDWKKAVFCCWATGCFSWFYLAFARIRRFDAHVKNTQPAPPEIQSLVVRCAENLGLPKIPGLRIVEGRISPMVWAATKPIVLLPAALIKRLTHGQLEGVVAHELAHIRRGDHWIRRLELLIVGVHWWNPLAWWVRRRLQEAEEASCDAIVSRALADKRREYTEALVTTFEFLSEEPTPIPVTATGFGRTTSIKRRITMILEAASKDRLSWKLRVGLAAIGVCLLGATFEFMQANASNGPTQKNDKPISTAKVSEEPVPREAYAHPGHFNKQISDPRRLRDLQEISSLGLSGTRITDEHLTILADLRELEELGFVDTSVTGPGLRHLSGLNGLKALTLVGPGVTDAWLDNLPAIAGLQSIDLTASRVTDNGVHNLKKFPNLEGLTLRYTQIGDQGLEVLKELPHLKSLSLTHTKVSDKGLINLRYVPALSYFSLASPNVRGPGIKHVQNLTNLKTLQFVGPGTTNEWLKHVQPLRNIIWIELHSTRVTEEGLAAISGWTQLKHACLNRNPIGDEVVKHLQDLYGLDSIALNDTKMTAEGIRRLREALPDASVSGGD